MHTNEYKQAQYRSKSSWDRSVDFFKSTFKINILATVENINFQ